MIYRVDWAAERSSETSMTQLLSSIASKMSLWIRVRAVSVLSPKFFGQDNILPQLLGESTPWIGLKKTQNNFQKTFPREQRFPSCLINKPRARLCKRLKLWKRETFCTQAKKTLEGIPSIWMFSSHSVCIPRTGGYFACACVHLRNENSVGASESDGAKSHNV